MAIDQRRYRSFAKETLIVKAIGKHNWEIIYLFLFGLPLIGAGILAMAEDWFRFLVLLITTFIASQCFGMTKAVICIAGSLKQSILPKHHAHLWREALVGRMARLVLPYLVLALLVGIARYGFGIDSMKAAGLIVGGATLGIALAILRWSGQRVWYDYFIAALPLVMLPFAWISWFDQNKVNINLAGAVLPICIGLLILLYLRIDSVSVRQKKSTEYFQNSRDFLSNVFRFQSLCDAQTPFVVMLFLGAPLLMCITIFYSPFHVDSGFWLRLYQTPFVIGGLLCILSIRKLHWRYFLQPKSGSQGRIGTDLFISTLFIIIISLLLWLLLAALVYWAVKISFGFSLPIEKIWLPVEIAIFIVEIFVWLALSVWLAAYLIRPRTFLEKFIPDPNNWPLLIMFQIVLMSNVNRLRGWQDRINMNAKQVLEGDTALVYFTSCAVLIVVFVHLANCAWASRDLSKILAKQHA